MTEKTLNDLFLTTLKDVYYAEKAILRALPKMAKAADSKQLKEALLKHRDETAGHVEDAEVQLFRRPEGTSLNQQYLPSGLGQRRRGDRSARPGSDHTGVPYRLDDVGEILRRGIENVLPVFGRDFADHDASAGLSIRHSVRSSPQNATRHTTDTARASLFTMKNLEPRARMGIAPPP